MNRKLQTFLITVLLPVSLFAQSKNEATDLIQARESRMYYTDSVQQQILGFAKMSSYYLNALIPNRISKAAASYTFQTGNYIRSQEATTVNAGNFTTEGSVILGTIKLFGQLAYEKTFEDSTRFAHQTRSNPGTPYYFGSPGYVHYERSVYSFKAMANKNFLKEKLNLALGTDYKVGDHFSTNDPRGSVGEYQFDLMASAGYQFSKHINAGFAYRNGYGQERVNIAYKNPRYYESSSFPMYINYLINGYGEATPQLDDRRYTDNQTRNGFDVYLDLKTASSGDFYLSGTALSENQRYFYSDGSGFTEYAQYDLDSEGINLLWLKSLNQSRMGLTINYLQESGRDHNLKYNANNYIYTAHNLSAKFFVNTAARANRSYTHFIKAQQSDEERVDGIRGNTLYYKNLTLTAGSGFRNTYDNQAFFGFNLAATYTLPMSDTFNVTQSAESYFTRYVIYHDYLYNTSSYAGGTLIAEYGRPIFKSMLASFKLNVSYNQKLDEKTINRTLSSTPGKDRFFSNVSLNLYF